MTEIADLCGLLGTDATLALTETHGGTRLLVPRKAAAVHGLRERLGDAAFFKLVQYFGGAVLAVPLARPWRAKIYRARGMTYPEIARMFGMTESAVGRMVRAQDGDGVRGRSFVRRGGVPGQLDMFSTGD